MTGWSLPAPAGVREFENEWIEMDDGVRLAVSLWLPVTDAPVPVVLEAIPYRKRDSTRSYSRFWGRKLAERGIAYARLDARGSGDSQGLLADEYLPREQQDCAAAIAWLAERGWCNGAVGMRGVSWGGFITLQTAALAPPALKAIMPFCATDRRFTDDAHYVGGVFALTGLKWAASFKAVMAAPPDPDVFGDGWAQAWRLRLEQAPPIAALWLGHQREDDYWRQGSVWFTPEAIRCPAYLVGGWADPYNAAIPRLLERLTVPRKALIGPWGHGFPQPASPGPGLDWIVEEARWWRHWLAGEPTGIMEDPQVWAFLPEAAPAEVAPGAIPGRWVAEPAWPPRAWPQVLPLGALASGAGVAELRSEAMVGLATPEWCPFSPPQYPQEQSQDDAASLVLDTDPLEAPLDLFGVPALSLRLAASAAVAHVAARLCEVTPDGRSWLVSYGVLNLTHRDGHEHPTPLTPGVFFDVELPLYVTARRFRAGSKLRLALSESLWPLVWPSPEAVTVTIDLAASSLTLPLRAAEDGDPDFTIPVLPAPPGSGQGDPVIRRERLGTRAAFTEVAPPAAATLRDIATTIEHDGPEIECLVNGANPAACHWRARQSVRYRRAGWDCTVESEVELASDATHFHVVETLVARRGETEVFRREDANAIPRDLM
jgi:hypothetical protein